MAGYEGIVDTPEQTGHVGPQALPSLNSPAGDYSAQRQAWRKERLLHIGPVRRLHPFYSRGVRFLKFILPIVALMLVIIVVVWPYIQKESIQLSIGFATGTIDGSETPTMVNPRYTGVDSDQQPFSVTADLAKNLVLDTTRVELEMPKADIILGDGTWLAVTAETGVYGRNEAVLDLSGAVNMFHDQGYEMVTDAIRIDLGARTAESVTAVIGQGPIGELRSEGLRMNNRDRVIYFTGKASLRLYPDACGGN